MAMNARQAEALGAALGEELKQLPGRTRDFSHVDVVEMADGSGHYALLITSTDTAANEHLDRVVVDLEGRRRQREALAGAWTR